MFYYNDLNNSWLIACIEMTGAQLLRYVKLFFKSHMHLTSSKLDKEKKKQPLEFHIFANSRQK